LADDDDVTSMTSRHVCPVCRSAGIGSYRRSRVEWFRAFRRTPVERSPGVETSPTVARSHGEYSIFVSYFHPPTSSIVAQHISS